MVCQSAAGAVRQSVGAASGKTDSVTSVMKVRIGAQCSAFEEGLTDWNWSRRSDLNRGPADYESAALPRSYAGWDARRLEKNGDPSKCVPRLQKPSALERSRAQQQVERHPLRLPVPGLDHGLARPGRVREPAGSFLRDDDRVEAVGPAAAARAYQADQDARQRAAFRRHEVEDAGPGDVARVAGVHGLELRDELAFFELERRAELAHAAVAEGQELHGGELDRRELNRGQGGRDAAVDLEVDEAGAVLGVPQHPEADARQAGAVLSGQAEVNLLLDVRQRLLGRAGAVGPESEHLGGRH